MPELLVAAGEVRLAPAPEPGGVKLTITPASGLLEASFTVTWRAEPNAVLTAVDCVPPPLTVMLAGAPAVLPRLKLADSAPTVAETA